MWRTPVKARATSIAVPKIGVRTPRSGKRSKRARLPKLSGNENSQKSQPTASEPDLIDDIDLRAPSSLKETVPTVTPEKTAESNEIISSDQSSAILPPLPVTPEATITSIPLTQETSSIAPAEVQVAASWWDLDPAKLSMKQLLARSRYMNMGRYAGKKSAMDNQEDETVRSTVISTPQVPESTPQSEPPTQDTQNTSDSTQALSTTEAASAESQAFTPLVRLADDGSMVVDESSLVVSAPHKKASLDEYEWVTEGQRNKVTNSSYRRRLPVDKWTPEEDRAFFKALSQFGTDFSLIESIFVPPRTRSQIRNKFKKEEKKNSSKIDYYLNKRTEIDLNWWKEQRLFYERQRVANPKKDRRRLPMITDRNPTSQAMLTDSLAGSGSGSSSNTFRTELMSPVDEIPHSSSLPPLSSSSSVLGSRAVPRKSILGLGSAPLPSDPPSQGSDGTSLYGSVAAELGGKDQER